MKLLATIGVVECKEGYAVAVKIIREANYNLEDTLWNNIEEMEQWFSDFGSVSGKKEEARGDEITWSLYVGNVKAGFIRAVKQLCERAGYRLRESEYTHDNTTLRLWYEDPQEGWSLQILYDIDARDVMIEYVGTLCEEDN